MKPNKVSWRFYVSPNKKLIPTLIGYEEFFRAYEWMLFNNIFNRRLTNPKTGRRRVMDKLYLASQDFKVILRLT